MKERLEKFIDKKKDVKEKEKRDKKKDEKEK